MAILGLARARLQPVVQGDLNNCTIVPRLCLPLHLAFDHRVNDGADAARFVRTITPGTGRILGEGVVVHRGGRTATMQGRVWAEETGKLLAHGTGSALLFPVVAE